MSSNSLRNAAGSATEVGGGFIAGFRAFIERGNAVELAVAVVLGAAFGAVVTAVVDGVINPLVGGLFGKPDLDRIWVITLNDAEILPGMVLTALIQFLLVALAVYAFIVVPINALAARTKRAQEAAPAVPPEELTVLREIRDLLAARR
jgi:large conductance mechanosensitive channel